MPSFLRRLLHRPALRLGDLGRPRSRSRLRNERFASYLASSNRKSIDTDRQDALLAGRVFLRRVLVVSAIAFLAWVVIESAQAVGIF